MCPEHAIVSLCVVQHLSLRTTQRAVMLFFSSHQVLFTCSSMPLCSWTRFTLDFQLDVSRGSSTAHRTGSVFAQQTVLHVRFYRVGLVLLRPPTFPALVSASQFDTARVLLAAADHVGFRAAP